MMRVQSARFFVYAHDLNLSFRFYTEILGLQVLDRVAGVTILAAGTTEIEVLQERREEDAVLDRRTGFILFVDDVEHAYATVTAHQVVILTEPASHADGSRIFYIADPDGLPIGISSVPHPIPPVDWLLDEQ